MYVFVTVYSSNSPTVIEAFSVYVYKENEITTPSTFIEELQKENSWQTNLSTATVPIIQVHNPPVVIPLHPENSSIVGGFPGWALAIIIPCGIAIILLPCWILLCVSLLNHHTRTMTHITEMMLKMKLTLFMFFC